jgi:hypothetical protein
MRKMDLPEVYKVRQALDQPRAADVRALVRQQILESRIRQRVQQGARIAVAVGSRGVANLATLVRTVIATLRELAYQPFVVAAMGSHGGATPQGQRELLASYGITADAMGVPVCTEMNTVLLGTNSWGEPVYWDRNAYEADAVVTLSRIKPHTDFHGPIESGIVKMLVIGLGKREGAATHHQYGVPGLRDMIRESIKVVLAKTRFALGLAILENAADETAFVQAVEPEALLDTEPRLLEKARSLMGRIPFDQLDLLVVGELGKNYSGTGMDTNVLGRQMVEGEPDRLLPKITRICVLDVSDESHGNAVGVGMADLTTQRLLDNMDTEITNINVLTSCFLLRSKLPVALANDRECIAMGLRTCWQPRQEKVRLALIPNTLELTELWISAPLVEEAKKGADMQLTEGARPLPFDASGNLQQEILFPHSVRGRRTRI